MPRFGDCDTFFRWLFAYFLTLFVESFNLFVNKFKMSKLKVKIFTGKYLAVRQGSRSWRKQNRYKKSEKVAMVAEEQDQARQAVMMNSTGMPTGSMEVRGYDFNEGRDISKMLRQFYPSTGFQASAFGEAIRVVNEMITCRSNGELGKDGKNKCKIFLGYTSNMVSSGMRDIIRFLVQHKMVDVLVTTAGGIEEDFIKCLAPSYVLGTFNADGADLRKNGMNRIGNLVVPNGNYCLFEDWLVPILDKMLAEQQNEPNTIWSPSKIIRRLGKEINHEDSIYYWCYKNDIPVYCPALTDGSLGDMIFFHSFRNPGFIVDIVQDIIGINRHAMDSENTGIIILGGGVVKHHICNANLMRNGADYALFINTAHEFDGSDSGASPEEAVSWGKLKATCRRVKLCADATLVFPLVVSETFARNFHQKQE